jgi:thiamine biosynthesis lipoprotein
MLEVYKFSCFTAPCELQIYSKDKNVSDACAKGIFEECKRLEKKYNYFDVQSYLSDLNNRIDNKVDHETKNLLSISKQYYKKTNGIFDITLCTLKAMYNEKTTIEIQNKKEELLAFVGNDKYEVKKDRLYFSNEITQIDLGGVVKEYSVDRAVMILKKYKIQSALVNFGGDIYALGFKKNKEKFKVAIKNPQDITKSLIIVELYNQALTTSASYERNITIDNIKYSHILSKAEQSNILSATVVSQNCLKSGIYSTSLMCDEKLVIKDEKYLITSNLDIIR